MLFLFENSITTPYTKTVPEVPFPEYPRPQIRRARWLNANGVWDMAITALTETPAAFQGKILVPFSPEAPLSGVGRTLMPDELLWYRKRIELPEDFFHPEKGERLLIHFGAVDQIATVYVNGKEAVHHEGGFTPFSADITDKLENEYDLTVTVRVRDTTDTSYRSRGKQSLKPGGIFYTPQSGIWQTVWLEAVPRTYIKSLKITPLFDESAVEIKVETNRVCACEVRLGERSFLFANGGRCRLPISPFRPWSPEDPHLYEFSVIAGEDRVESYFAMRKFAAKTDKHGIRRLYLNGKPYFHTGVLDQGYWPDGLLTAPSDKAMIDDIVRMKEMGFNTLRKHVKIEPLRWYFHCDRLGMLVWQDMPNGGSRYRFTTTVLPLFTGKHLRDTDYERFARADIAGRQSYCPELAEMITALYNCPSVAMWVPFNEGWGQFDAAEALKCIRELDTTRTVDHASGWHDQGLGNIKSVHCYFRPYRFTPDTEGRAVALTEFGGYSLRIEGHSQKKKSFGYKKIRTKAQLQKAITALYEKQLVPVIKEGLSAAIYTQVSDVETEVNGLFTYDRKKQKIPFETMRRLNEALIAALKEATET